MLSILLAAICMFSTRVYAGDMEGDEKQDKTVRVGWFESPFNQTDRFGRRSGYAYEYQQSIAAYTGWNYEYVEGSWPELFQMLLDGKIDLMSDISYTEERAEKMLFPGLPMGAEEYYAFISDNGDSGIKPGDIMSLDGKRIGVNKGSVQKDLFLQWEEKNGIRAELVELTADETDSVAMLNKGDIDAYISIDAFQAYRGILPVCKTGSSNYYFAVSKSRPDLLRELEQALNRIQSENIYYNQQLQKKYFSISDTNLLLSQDELEWVTEHGAVRVGYRDNYLAFCEQDKSTGELTGALRDFLDMASHCMKNAEIVFEPVPFPTTEKALEALKNGEVDCVFPMNISVYDGEKIGVLTTVPQMQTEMYAVVREGALRDFSLDGEITAAVNEGNPSYETFLMDNFPEWERAYYKDIEACFKAVADKEADCVLISNYRIHRLSELFDKYRLSSMTTGISMNTSFVVSRNNNNLYSILNKATAIIPASTVNSSLVSYSYVEPSFTAVDFIRDNIVLVLAAVCAVLAVFLLLLLRSKRSERETREALDKIAVLNDEQNRRLNEIAELNEILSESQKNLQEALAASEQASRAKTIFLSNMSHEIRTPMNAIIGLDTIALRDETLPPHTREQFEKIGASARHLLGIINDILDMSRIESGRLTLKEEEFAFRSFLDQINAMINSQCVDKGISYSCRIIGKVEDYYFGDDMKLKQVLISILGNAVKFTEASGKVSLTVEQTARFEDHCTLRFVISDTGIGMSREYLPRLFEAFSQENDTIGKRYGSTGLGLAITKNIVEMMNGQIKVESEKGVGSTFTVSVTLRVPDRADSQDQKDGLSKNLSTQVPDNEPAAPEHTGPAADESLPDTETVPENLAGCRVLIAEDIEINAEILMDLLEMEEVDSEHALNGRIAVEMFEKSPEGHYDAVLMDIRMPEMNGLEAAQAIRALDRPDAGTIPIIALTANAFEEDVQRSLQAGMNAHLSKPVDSDRLCETLYQLIYHPEEDRKFKCFARRQNI